LKASTLAASLSARLIGDADAEVGRVVHPAEAKEPGDLAVALTPDTLRAVAETRAELILATESAAAATERFRTTILLPASRTALASVTELFRHRPTALPGIHPTAILAPDAEVAPDASVGPFSVVGAGARIGTRTVILGQATLAEHSAVGADCLIYPGVRIGWGCRVGDRAIIHSNASIGADGFGFISSAPGGAEAARDGVAASNAARNPLHKIHALGAVEIGDDVEIGALTAIDRGTLKPTRIGSGSKIDDLVMIGHNVEIGTDCMLCGQVALAGSVVVGDRAVLGGRAAVADHLKIGVGAVVGGGSLVGTNVPAGAVYLGVPAVPRAEALDNLKLMHRIRRFLDSARAAKNKGPDGQVSP
jgi:UDP-3-O-[3-hydroxymyristoyl] glucosamine N-acyltransferase